MRKSNGKHNKKPKKLIQEKTNIVKSTELPELLFYEMDTDDKKSLQQEVESKKPTLMADLQININMIKSILNESDDLIYRSFSIPTKPSIKATVVYIENMVDARILETSVLLPLTQTVGERTLDERDFFYSNKESLLEEILINADIEVFTDINLIINKILVGSGILLLDNYPKAISISMSKGAEREYSEPQAEKVVKGPQQGFVENIQTNIAIIRKKVSSPNLVIKNMELGRETTTKICVVYLKNIAENTIVEELFNRLNRIDVDGITGSQYIEEYINDAPFNLFPTILSTERPDRANAMLLEGRVVIICDGTPFALVVPSIIADFFSTPEEYYSNPYFATLNRFLSYSGALIVMFLPSIYIALTTFHQEMLPTRLALTLAGTRAGVPYPAFVEALMMEIAFEALREAGTRLPTHVGQAVSIVGALIIGQAAVEAGLVSPAVVIIVAITAIFSFTIPYNNFSTGLRLTRFFNMALGATLGIYGIMTGILLISLNLISLRSFNVPFMIPFAPLSPQEIKDWVLRVPQWAITKRSTHITKKNITKKPDTLRPSPPKQ